MRQVRIQNMLLSNGIAHARVTPGTMALVDHAFPRQPTGNGRVGWYNLDAAARGRHLEQSRGRRTLE